MRFDKINSLCIIGVYCNFCLFSIKWKLLFHQFCNNRPKPDPFLCSNMKAFSDQLSSLIMLMNIKNNSIRKAAWIPSKWLYEICRIFITPTNEQTIHCDCCSHNVKCFLMFVQSHLNTSNTKSNNKMPKSSNECTIHLNYYF